MHATAQLNAALAGHYSIDREIGAGGMATVYLARDLRHDRAVALKVLRPDLGAVLGAERFLSEIRVTANLQHPNLLPLFDSGEIDGLLFYVMPYVPGGSLRALLDDQEQLPVEDALHIAVCVAGALDHAHRHGVIHRDLKPENILLQEGEPLVADFGIALAVSNAGGNRITQTGISLGTPAYMSPEQATADRRLDERSDIYSLGAVLYEMLAGEPPHAASTAQAILARVLTEKPAPVRARRDTVPPHVEAALDRALAKIPADRFASAHEFAEALAARQGALAPAGASTYGTLGPMSRDRRWPARAAWVALVVAAAALTGGVVWNMRAGAPRAPTRFALTTGDSIELSANAPGPVLALSRDGRTLAFVARSGNVRQLFVRALGELVARPVPGTEGALRPVFSPDGRWIAWGGANVGALRRTALATGQTTTLVSQGVTAFDWSEDGTILFVRNGGLWRMAGAGGEPALVAAADTARGERFAWPAAVGTTGTVLCNVVPNEYGGGAIGNAIGNTDVVVVERSGRVRRLGIRGSNPRWLATGHILFAQADGSVLAVPYDAKRERVTGAAVPVIDQVVRKIAGAMEVAVSADGTLVYLSGGTARQILLLDRAGGETTLVDGSALDALSHPRFSPDGRRIAFQSGSLEGGDVWVMELGTRTLTRVTQNAHSANPEWTGDGRHMVFWSGTSARANLVESSLDGGATRTLVAGLHPDEIAIALAGRRVILRRPQGDGDLFGGSLDSMDHLRPWAATASLEQGATFSPDGNWVAYVSNETGVNQVYVRPFAGSGARVQVSVTGGIWPHWSHDGRTVFYRGTREVRGATSPQLVGAHLVLGAEPRVTQWDTVFTGARMLNLGSVYGYDFDVARDDAHFAVLSNTDPVSPPIVVLDWFTELRERMAAAAKR